MLATSEQAANPILRGAFAAQAGLSEQRIELGPEGPSDRGPIQPLEVAGLYPRNFAERPAAVPSEVEHAS
jgi:hypothetical protein